MDIAKKIEQLDKLFSGDDADNDAREEIRNWRQEAEQLAAIEKIANNQVFRGILEEYQNRLEEIKNILLTDESVYKSENQNERRILFKEREWILTLLARFEVRQSLVSLEKRLDTELN